MLEMSHKAGGVPALGAAVMTSADILMPDSAIMNVPFVSVPVLSKDNQYVAFVIEEVQGVDTLLAQ